MSIIALVPFVALLAQQPVSSSSSLDFEYFKTKIQPILLAKREGHARCVSCHTTGTPMRFQPLSPGAAMWNEEESRKNFEVIRARVVAGNPLKSKLLTHPLAEEAGGDPSHDGGKHWMSQDDREFQVLAAWVRGDARNAPTAANKVRIIQTNSAGDTVSIIDPVTNKVVGEVKGIEVNHGAAAAPDGSRLYVSNEAESTLDVVDARTLKVTNKIKLSGHPNNISISRDGRRVYVSIAQAPGAVDVVDTATMQRAKSINIRGNVHNTYVTPDGRFVVAGSVVGKTLTVIDAQTEDIAWVVDFATHKEVTRVELPKLAAGKAPFLGGGNVSHGLAVTEDGKMLVVNSRLNSAVYAYSLPDLKLLGSAEVGKAPDWVTLTPDSKRAYVANAQSNSVSVIDLQAMKELTRIPVGQVPKRNITALLP